MEIKKSKEDFETPPSSGCLRLTTWEILWAPKPKVGQNREKSSLTSKRKLSFSDASSPIKEYVSGWNQTKVRLAACQCYIRAETCEEVPCKCPKKQKFNEESLTDTKKISLKCKCPVECKPFQAAQELF